MHSKYTQIIFSLGSTFKYFECGFIYWFCSTQPWLSNEDDGPPFSPVLRKKAVKVKHVKRRENKFDKKVSKLYF